jgi:hypothetical protein
MMIPLLKNSNSPTLSISRVGEQAKALFLGRAVASVAASPKTRTPGAPCFYLSWQGASFSIHM